jgi:hypothetical protein
VWTRFATSNASVQFTPLAGTNWQEISETAMDSDTSYNSTTNVGFVDEFLSSGTLPTGFTPLYVKLQQASRADQPSGHTTANLLVSGSDTFTGASSVVGTIYLYSEDYLLTDPNGAIPWTGASIAATKFGYVLEA